MEKSTSKKSAIGNPTASFSGANQEVLVEV